MWNPANKHPGHEPILVLLQHLHRRSLCSSDEKLTTGLCYVTLENTGVPRYRESMGRDPWEACAGTEATKGCPHLVALWCLGARNGCSAVQISLNHINRRVPRCPNPRLISPLQKSSSQSRSFGQVSISSTCSIQCSCR